MPSDKGTTTEEYKKASEYLNELANRTGGRLYKASTIANLSDTFSRIASELREYYSIGYYDGKSENNSKDEVIKHKDLNRESAFFFFEYLFDYAKVKCDKKKRAETIERLTGYSHKKIVPLFAWLEKEKLYIEEKKGSKRKIF